MDGSKVLSINNIYTQDITTRGIVKLAARMADGFGIDKSMFVYGTGDHGGGPTRRDLKKIQLLRSFPTMPSLKFSTTEEFYTMIEEEYGDILPVRDGEMNFVFDGCYTSHSDVKQENRFCENALESSETLSVAAMLKGLPYDSEAYEQAWRRTLFNQFHDIFDGCGVEDTYRFTNAQAEQVMQFTAASNAKALAHLGGGEAKLCGNIKACIAFNPTGWERLEPFTVPCPSNAAGWMAVDSEGRELPVQKVADDLWITLPLPALGHRTFLLKEMAEAKPAPTGIAQNETHFLVETPYWSVEIKKSTGQITTLFDKRENRYVVRKEVINWRLQNGTLNTLQLHYEEPTHYSAWTLGNITRTENLHNASSSILADGPVVKILRFIHDTAEGQICQDIRIYMDNPRIDFVTEVDWKGYGYFDRDAPMLRVSFSPDVRNADAVYDIPFGALHRPCKDNEYPAQKWVDISDGGYGFSVLNNCKYGHKVMGNRVELDLLRSPWHPDRYSAVGKHTFVYSILPHAGNYTAGETVKHACFLNQPSLVGQLPTVCADSPAPQFGLLTVENKSIVVAAVKKAETGGDVILRLYNSAECEITSAISLHFPTTAIVEADLLENPTGKCLACDGTFIATMYPFEIKTYRISLKTDAGT